MKTPRRYVGAVLLLIALVALPALATAQSPGAIADAAAAASSSLSRFYQEGPSDSGSARVQQIQGYRQQASGLQQKISALPVTANPSVLMPVLFGVDVKDISPNFGDPRSNGRTHEGEDIIAVKGTPIVSPTSAVVLRTEVGVSEGNAVYTANPGGETFVYMHLDHFGEGVVSGLVLNQGSLIGYVGNTGDAAGGPAHLHFEIHNPAGTPVDPFPRLTGELTLQEKMTYLATILTQTADSTALSDFLVTNFRGTFIDALAANVSLPLQIIDAMATIPASTVPVSAAGTLPAGDLDIGSSGPLVVALQQYLIQAASGAAATRLAGATATGNFGVITKAALVEFQVAVGIAPPSGYYGPSTRAFIVAHPLGSSQQTGTPISSTAGGAITLSRDLYQGISGDDVRALQIFLNARGFTVAAAGSGSPGSETNYFGPATAAAVVRFQIARGITPAAGYVGPITRAAIASLGS